MKKHIHNILLIVAAAGISLLLMSCAAGNFNSAFSSTASNENTAPISESEISEPDSSTETTAHTATQTTAQTTMTQITTVNNTTVATTANTTAQTTPEKSYASNVTVKPSTTPPATKKSETTAVTAAQTQESRPAKETAYTAEMYVNKSCASHIKADESSSVVRRFKLNEKVDITASTDNGFYRLKSGGYLAKEFLCPGKTVAFSTSTSQSDAVAIPKKPPASTDKSSDFYDPAKAIAYARSNWNNGIGHCAAFAEKCLEAGGVYGLSDIGATTLYNQLMASGLGYAVQLTRDKDGYLNAKDYAFPGDIIFFYCPTDKRMIHAVVYNGSTEDGLVQAYSHNPANNGQGALNYSMTCPDDCGTEIKTAALFCFYRNPINKEKPDSLPVLSVKPDKDTADFSWTADYLYNDSALVVTDENGSEVYRRSMKNSASHSLRFYSDEEYTAYIETYIGDITVKSNEVKFRLPMANNKPEEVQ